MLLSESSRSFASNSSLSAWLCVAVFLAPLVHAELAAAQGLELLPGVAERIAPSSQDRGVALGGGQI